MRLPAEWEKQSGVQLTWPHDETEWFELEKVLETYVEIAYHILRFQPLMIVARDIEEAKRDIELCSKNKGLIIDFDKIRFFQAPLNDTWARDHSGISVIGNEGEKYLYDFVFNGWGLKFPSNLDNQLTKTVFHQSAFEDDVLGVDMRPFVLEGGSIESDGRGTLLTTTECLTSLNRNEYLSKDEIEDELKTAFGLERVLYLENGGIIGDDTDSHIDTLARFCNPNTIAYVKCYDENDEHFESLEKMEAELMRFKTLEGKPYKLVPLPLSEPLYLEDYRLPASYANFLIINGAVLVPGANSEYDEIAKERLQSVFPNREVVVIDCRALLSGHDSLHCITMQYPENYIR